MTPGEDEFHRKIKVNKLKSKKEFMQMFSTKGASTKEKEFKRKFASYALEFISKEADNAFNASRHKEKYLTRKSSIFNLIKNECKE